MIKITLKNGVIVEFDSPKEASQFLHSLHWREYLQSTKTPVIENGETIEIIDSKHCVICKEKVKRSNSKLCGKLECKKEAKKRYQRRWHKKHPNYQQKTNVPITIVSESKPEEA